MSIEDVRSIPPFNIGAILGRLRPGQHAFVFAPQSGLQALATLVEQDAFAGAQGSHRTLGDLRGSPQADLPQLLVGNHLAHEAHFERLVG